MAPRIIFKNVSYNYSSGRNGVDNALSHVSFQIKPGSFTTVIGRTGSGKSTLVQQVNGLLRPTAGSVSVGNLKVTANTGPRGLKQLRQTVGMVFQISQDQLFGETVKDDLAFGPRNFGFKPRQIKSAVNKSSRLLDLTDLMAKSPFDLSGGQMKRVAIAGTLACRPKVLILDEPTVGLDHHGNSRIMKIINNLRRKFGLTILMVTHQMNLVAKYATQVLVLSHGKLMADVKPERLFSDQQLLNQTGLVRPFAPRMAENLAKSGVKLAHLPLTITDLANQIAKAYKSRRNHE